MYESTDNTAKRAMILMIFTESLDDEMWQLAKCESPSKLSPICGMPKILNMIIGNLDNF